MQQEPSPVHGEGAAFQVAPNALKRIDYLLSDEPPGTWFWVRVDGGGCSGFQYLFSLEQTAPEAGDFTQGAIAVDAVSLDYLKDSVLDWVEDLSSAGFEVKNPNATARCGCGNSFAVAM